MDHVIGFAVRGISRGIAVTSEVAAGKRRSSADEKATNTTDVDDSDEDITSREQDLDDAIDSEEDDKKYPGTEDLSVQDITNSFIRDFQTDAILPSTLQPLPQSVILPQRRPKTRSRGFVRAYAPILGECSGIDQETFIQFLINFDLATQAWPVFKVMNMAAMGIGMVPHAPFMAASVALQTVAMVGQEVQTRYDTNKFLDEINETFFKPRKLYALIMTYQPDMADDIILRADVTNPQQVALSNALSRDAQNSLRKKLSRFGSVSKGTVQHESQMPDPAPLIYPSLDRKYLEGNQNAAITAAPSPDTSTSSALQPVKSSSSSLKPVQSQTKSSLVQDYLDRRAQALFVAENPNSKLAQTLPPQEKKFVNRFADPNHPVNSGSIFGLVTGGTFDPIAQGRVRRAESAAKKQGQPPLTKEERHDAYMGRKVRGRVTGTPSKNGIFGLGKILKKNVLYLVITNLPDGQELAVMAEQ